MSYIEKRRQLKISGPVPKEKKVYKIPARSKTRIKEDRTLKKLFLERFIVDPRCQLKSPVCTKISQGFDHTQKTSPGNRLKPENLKLSCNACNMFKETAEGQIWAKETGNHISRFKK